MTIVAIVSGRTDGGSTTEAVGDGETVGDEGDASDDGEGEALEPVGDGDVGAGTPAVPGGGVGVLEQPQTASVTATIAAAIPRRLIT